MEVLRFIHQFFHLSQQQAEVSWRSRPDWRAAERLFAEPHLARRSLAFGEVRNFQHARSLFDSVQREEEDMGLRVLAAADYPPALVEHLPPERRPAILYLRGHDLPPERKSVAMVGTRSPSVAGLACARNFATYFSSLGLSVISGLAKGVDALAHEENLLFETVAVLGSGVGNVYPRENQALAELILASGGSLLSPFPLYQVPLPQNFPARNEIIAALAYGTVVVEGAEQSGAAITGRQALAMGKTVVALAQDFRTPFGRGAVRLQQAGAVFVANEEEALQAIFARAGGFSRGDAVEVAFGSRRREFRFEEFRSALGMSVAEAAALLEEGILRGRIVRVKVDRYRLAKRNG